MKIIFLTIGGFKNVNQNGVYTDLLRHFRDQGHEVYVVCQREKREKLYTELKEECGIYVLRVRTGNITKVNFIEKGISTLCIGQQYNRAIRKFLGNIKFDLVLYTTPPITLANVVKKVKSSSHAVSYLMLKDIFPQNAVDLGILKTTGIKKIAYIFFRRKEKQLYKLSDKIGCMSQANLDYIKSHNAEIPEKKLEICPNTIDDAIIEEIDTKKIRAKYKIPFDKTVFVYGGNFGKPQNVNFIVEVLRRSAECSYAHFVMCGSGTDFHIIENYAEQAKPKNLTVIKGLEFYDYKELLLSCDIGMIFLDWRFTIPNFPSRLVDYMNYKLPVFALTDKNTDLRNVILENDFGWWCESNNIDEYIKQLKKIEIILDELHEKGEMSKKCLREKYKTEYAYNQIINAYNQISCNK